MRVTWCIQQCNVYCKDLILNFVNKNIVYPKHAAKNPNTVDPWSGLFSFLSTNSFSNLLIKAFRV